jgi:alkanesulfonate monooxygenase SsuD/methylene tetrahydromethanopterin reductase-like flavin-dependent oxidoreductase (luciferase family)
MYRERCAAYGKAPGAIVLRRDIYVGETSAEAQAALQQAVRQGDTPGADPGYSNLLPFW